MLEMVRSQISPSLGEFTAVLARNAAAKRAVEKGLSASYETKLLKKLSALNDVIFDSADDLDSAVKTLYSAPDIFKKSEHVRDRIIPAMEKLRKLCDEAEIYTAKEYRPFPIYSELLFST